MEIYNYLSNGLEDVIDEGHRTAFSLNRYLDGGDIGCTDISSIEYGQEEYG